MFHEPTKSTDQETVLKAVATRLMTELPSVFTPANVRHTLDPDPPDALKSHTLVATITPLAGEFDAPGLDGGGAEVCIEQTGVILAFWTRQNTDQAGHAGQLLFGLDNDKTRALLRIKQRCLKMFTGHMLRDPQDEQPILTELMLPVKSLVPRYDTAERGGGFADLQLAFTTPFLWDLTPDS